MNGVVLRASHLGRVVAGKTLVADATFEGTRGDILAITSLVPIGSMIIANAMNANGLALGAVAATSVSPYVQSSFEASLIPAIDSIRSLGIVWIPGLMAGMLVSGASPIYASIYQFVTLAMMLAASGLTSLVSTLLIRGRIFSPADQLLHRGQAYRLPFFLPTVEKRANGRPDPIITPAVEAQLVQINTSPDMFAFRGAYSLRADDPFMRNQVPVDMTVQLFFDRQNGKSFVKQFVQYLTQF